MKQVNGLRVGVIAFVSITAASLPEVALAQTVLDLSPDKPLAPGVPVANGGTKLSDIRNTADLLAQLVISGDATQYDTLLIRADLTDRFGITESLIVASLPDAQPAPQFHALNNLIFRGKNRSTDTIYLHSEAVSPRQPAPGPNSPYSLFLTSIEVDQARLIVGNPVPGDPFFNGVTLKGLKQLTLSNGAFKLARTSDVSSLELSGNSTSTITSKTGANEIDADIVSLNPLLLEIKAGSTLDLVNGSRIEGVIRSKLSMETGSKLNVKSSGITLSSNASLPSQIDGAELNVTGASSYVIVTDLKVKDSTVNLDNNTYLRSYTAAGNFSVDGRITFSGTSALNLSDGAWVSTSSDINDPYRGEIYVDGGTTTFGGPVTGLPSILPQYKTAELHVINKGHLIVNPLMTGSLSEISRLEVLDASLTLNAEANINKLQALNFDNAKIVSQTVFWKSASYTVNNSQFTFGGPNGELHSHEFSGRQSSTPFTFTGSNSFNIRLTPIAQVVVPGVFSKSNDSLNFIDANVTGLGNVQFNILPLLPNQSAKAYAMGGNNGDGIYDLVFLSNSTADTDAVTFKLDGSMPALLTATQVKTPSADNRVSIKLTENSLNALSTHPTLTTPNQQAAVAMLANAVNAGGTGGSGGGGSAGGTAIQNALGSVSVAKLATDAESLHPEMFASNMTISLSQANMIMNSVLSHSAPGRSVAAGNSTDNGGRDATRFVWSDASQVRGSVDGISGLSDFDYRLTSLAFGAHVLQDETDTLGVYVAFARQRLDSLRLVSEDLRGNSFHLGGYWYHANDDGLAISAVAGAMRGSHKSRRFVSFSGLGGEHRAAYNSVGAYLGARISKEILKSKFVSIMPTAGVTYTYFGQDSLRESGDPYASLFLKSANAHAIVTSLGANVRFANLSKKLPIYPMFMASYEHDWYASNNRAHQVAAGVIAAPNVTQTFVGQNKGPNALVLGAGLGSELSSALRINGGVVRSSTSNGREWGFGFNASLRW